MSRTPWVLVRKNLLAHWLRSLLTVSAVSVALLLFCLVVSLVTTLDSAVKSSATNRIITQSAVSLFVSMPLDYQPKISNTPGVSAVSKLQWFGGYYQVPENYFAQFGVDHETFFEQYRRDLEIVEGPPGAGPARERALEAFNGDRRAAIVGEQLTLDFGWKVGDTVPLIPTLYTRNDGGAWEFNIVGIYRPLKSNVDGRTIWFRFDYLEETQDGGLAQGPQGVGCYTINVADGHEPAEVIAAIDRLFENGPQKTMTSSEAAFQASFVSMLGNLPMFVGAIGGAVVFAVFFSVVNTMLMAARQRIPDTGILKALGFKNTSLVMILVGESLTLSLVGGGFGVAAAMGMEEPVRSALAAFFPTFAVESTTLLWGLGIAAGIGVIAGLAPAAFILSLKPTDALRNEG